MIIEVRKGKERDSKVFELCTRYNTSLIEFTGKTLLVTSSSVKSIDHEFNSVIANTWTFETDMQLSSIEFKLKTEIPIDQNILVSSSNTLIISGPCSIESEEQIQAVAQFLSSMGIKVIRAGAYKPRTSPYSFQGMGREGLVMLRRVADGYNMKVITEARDATHVHEVLEYADIIQVGAKAMYDHGILQACGNSQKPILLKRGFGSTVQEFVQAAEFILSRGNPNVILCERGIRTFEFKTRFTLDLCGVSYLKQFTNLPIFVDPSHAMGYAYGVADLSRACIAMGVEGLLIETHPDPPKAKSDASQQLNFEQFKSMLDSLRLIAPTVGRKLI